MSRPCPRKCDCGRVLEYGPGNDMCRQCSLDHISGLRDIDVVGHLAVHVILSGGRLVGVALVIPEDRRPTDPRHERHKDRRRQPGVVPKKILEIDIVA